MSAQDVSQASEIKIGDHTFDLITSIWTRALTQKSPEESAKHRHHLQIEKREPGKRNTWLRTPKCISISTRQAFSAPCSTAVNLDHLNETERRLNSFHLRCLRRILGVKWQDHINNSEISPACPPFAASAAWDGSDMFIAWMMDASPRKFYSDNWKQESGKPGAPPCGSWKLTNVTSKHAKLIQAIGTMLLVNVPAGDGQWKEESRMQTWNLVLQSALGFC